MKQYFHSVLKPVSQQAYWFLTHQHWPPDGVAPLQDDTSKASQPSSVNLQPLLLISVLSTPGPIIDISILYSRLPHTSGMHSVYDASASIAWSAAVDLFLYSAQSPGCWVDPCGDPGLGACRTKPSAVCLWPSVTRDPVEDILRQPAGLYQSFHLIMNEITGEGVNSKKCEFER